MPRAYEYRGTVTATVRLTGEQARELIGAEDALRHVEEFYPGDDEAFLRAYERYTSALRVTGRIVARELRDEWCDSCRRVGAHDHDDGIAF